MGASVFRRDCRRLSIKLVGYGEVLPESKAREGERRTGDNIKATAAAASSNDGGDGGGSVGG